MPPVKDRFFCEHIDDNFLGPPQGPSSGDYPSLAPLNTADPNYIVKLARRHSDADYHGGRLCSSHDGFSVHLPASEKRAVW